MNARRLRVVRLTVSVLALIAGMGPLASALAQERLAVASNFDGAIHTGHSYDRGTTWASWFAVTQGACQIVGGGGTPPPNDVLTFVGAPALVSLGNGGLVMVARATNGAIYFTSTNNDHSWFCWLSAGSGFTSDGIRIGGDHYRWNVDSSPTVSSHGPSRMDVFIVARRVRDGAQSLLHGYSTGGMSWTWEFLGSGYLTGSPAAISWAHGRIDVFARTANNTLVYKWFDGGRWSPGFDHLGGDIISSPSVASAHHGHLDVYAIRSDQALVHTWYVGGWSAWEDLGGTIGLATDPVATSSGHGHMEVFVYHDNRRDVYQRKYTWGTWGVGVHAYWPSHVPMAAAYWTP